MSKNLTEQWLEIRGFDTGQLANGLAAQVAQWSTQGIMPRDEEERVARLSTSIAKGAFVVSSERLELLRNLCHLYAAGIRAEKITSHRPLVGPVIVFAKRVFFRVLSSLLGPSFQFQRDFNAGVIRLLGDLCNEDRSDSMIAKI